MVIYRKYRPQRFEDVTGQENIIKILKGALKRNNIGHAYLFSGPRGTGKTTIARIFSKTINCEKPDRDFEPCGKCGACMEIAAGKSLDFVEIDAASNRGIDEIRQLRDGINFSPAKNKYRVFILDEAHMLTKEAFNALLKTLEEPPEHAIFILATTEINKIPATIISRCQKFDFGRLSIDKIARRLAFLSKEEGISAEKEALEIIARNCEGCLRDAESLLGQIASLNQGKVSLLDAQELLGLPDPEFIKDFSRKVLEKNAPEAMRLVDKILETGKDLFAVSSSLISYLRGVLMIKISPELEEIVLKNFTGDDLDFMKELARLSEIKDLIFAIKTLAENQEKIKRSEFPQISLEIAIAEITLGISSYDQLLPNMGKDDSIKSEKGAKKEEPAAPARAAQSSSGDESGILESAREKWEDILFQVKEKNTSVFAFLKTCAPACILNNNLHFATNYQFYKERLNTTQSRMIIESVLKDVLHLEKSVGFKCLMEEELKEMGVEVKSLKIESKKSKTESGSVVGKQDDLIAEALKMFGGTAESITN